MQLMVKVRVELQTGSYITQLQVSNSEESGR